MTTWISGDARAAECLSALADGEVDAATASAACNGWRSDAEARRIWHTYHLIGDVLRSDDFASAEDRDGHFLLALRARLALEPVILAPGRGADAGDHEDAAAALPVAARVAVPPAGRPMRWMLPSAMAAGLVLAVATFTLTRPGTIAPGAAPSLAAAPAPLPSGSLRQASTGGAAEAPARVVAGNKLVRDARLDRYLAAHKQFSGTSALGVPSAFLRSATVDAERR